MQSGLCSTEKFKVKFALGQSTKAQKGCRGEALHSVQHKPTKCTIL